MPDAGHLTFVRIHRDVPNAAAWLTPVCQRIKTMAERYTTEGDSTVTTVLAAYTQRDPRVGVWAIIRDTALVGHVMVKTREWDGETLGWIHQIEHDGIASQASWDEALALVMRTWVPEVNAAYAAANLPTRVTRVVASTMHDAKFFERRAGFRPWRTLLIREVA